MLCSIAIAAVVLAFALFGCDDVHTGSCEFRGETRKGSLIVIARDGDVKNGTFHLSSFQCGINPHATTLSHDHTQRHTLSELPSDSQENIGKMFAAEGPRKAETCREVAEELRKEASGPVYLKLFDHEHASIDRILDRLCSLVASANVGPRRVSVLGDSMTTPEQANLHMIALHNGG